MPTPQSGRRVYLVDRPGAVQSSIYVGLPVTDPSSPDWIALEVTNTLLGGSFGSRLTTNLREQKGYTYSPFSAVSARPHDAWWAEIADVTTKDTGASIKEIFAEMQRLRREAPPEAELRSIQSYLTGVFVLRNSSRSGITNQLNFLDLHGLPASWLSSYVREVNAVTPARVREIADRWLKDDQCTVVVVGDAKTVKEQLAPFGEVIQ